MLRRKEGKTEFICPDILSNLFENKTQENLKK